MNKGFEGHAVIVRRRWWFLALSWGGMVNLVPVSVYNGWPRYALAMVSLPFLFSSIRNAWPKRRPVALRARASGIWIDGQLALRRDQIATGYALTGSVVRIVPTSLRQGLPFELELESAEQARELVDALGLGIARSTARFSAIYGGKPRQHRGALGMGLALIFAAVMSAMTMVPGSPSAFLLSISIVPVLLELLSIVRSQAKIVVGADGVFVSRLLNKELIAFDDLRRVSTEDGDVVFHRREKPSLRLGFGVDALLGREAGLVREAFVQCLEDAREAHAAGLKASAPRVAALVARGDKSVKEWLASIRALAAAGSYRDSALMPDQFLRIVEDPAAEPSARAGAAVALGPVLDGEGRGRLRIAAETCAAPALKAALEASAREQAEAEALEEALGAVSGGSSERSARRPSASSGNCGGVPRDGSRVRATR